MLDATCTPATLTSPWGIALPHWNWHLLFGLRITPRYLGHRRFAKPIPYPKLLVTTDYTCYVLGYFNAQSQTSSLPLIQTCTHREIHVVLYKFVKYMQYCTSIFQQTPELGRSYSHSHQYHINKLRIMGEHITQTLPLIMWKYSSVRVWFKSSLGKQIYQWAWMLSSLNIINWCVHWTTGFSFLLWDQWDHTAWGTIYTALIFLEQKKIEPWNYYLAVLVSIYKRKKKKHTSLHDQWSCQQRIPISWC